MRSGLFTLRLLSSWWEHLSERGMDTLEQLTSRFPASVLCFSKYLSGIQESTSLVTDLAVSLFIVQFKNCRQLQVEISLHSGTRGLIKGVQSCKATALKHLNPKPTNSIPPRAHLINRNPSRNPKPQTLTSQGTPRPNWTASQSYFFFFASFFNHLPWGSGLWFAAWGAAILNKTNPKPNPYAEYWGLFINTLRTV